MDKINIVIMGKTGTGKSTVVNAILKEDLAPTGNGQAVTKENQLYTKNVMLPIGTNGRLVSKKINIYDTVGLEIDSNITMQTLDEIQELIIEAKENETLRDVSLVWFCVNDRCNRFEQYEVDLIKELSSEYEIPFVVVITQCYSNEKGDLERQIETYIPEIAVRRILAKDYRSRSGVVEAFGLMDLLRDSVIEYNSFKIQLIESKLDKLNSLISYKEDRLERIDARGKRIISDYADNAGKIGWIPGLCIPIVLGMAAKMLNDLAKNAGLKEAVGRNGDFYMNLLAEILLGPLFFVPILSAGMAVAFIQQIGDDFHSSLMSALRNTPEYEWSNDELMISRLKEELGKRKKGKPIF